MLSVVLVNNKHTPALEKLCHQELRGEDYELIKVDSWYEGLKKSKGAYITFMEAAFDIGEGYFHAMLDVFLDQPSFRKMAMVAAATSTRQWGWDLKIYGHTVTPDSILPAIAKSSRNPYAVQIGFIPGAIIRKRVLTKNAVFNEDFGIDPVMDSVRLSLHFWKNGLRNLINPRATYYTTTPSIELPIRVADQLPDDVAELMLMFRRETIG